MERRENADAGWAQDLCLSGAKRTKRTGEAAVQYDALKASPSARHEDQ